METPKANWKSTESTGKELVQKPTLEAHIDVTQNTDGTWTATIGSLSATSSTEIEAVRCVSEKFAERLIVSGGINAKEA